MKKAILFLSTLFLLTACSTNEETNNHKEHNEIEVHMLEVDLQVPTETVKVNEEQQFSATVSYGDENVTDADEVLFEIREVSESKGTFVEAKHSKDGVYEITHTFTKAGEYHITSHVTAKGSHNMPAEMVLVEE